MAVRAGVSVDCAANRARDACQGLDATQSGGNREIDERLQACARTGRDAVAIACDSPPRVAKHHASIPLLRDNHIASVAEHVVGNAAAAAASHRRRESFRFGSRRKQIGGAADPKPGMLAQGDIFSNVQARNLPQHGRQIPEVGWGGNRRHFF